MKSLLCLLAAGALLTAPLHAKIVRNVEKTFTVQPGGTFRGSTQGGDIKVTSADIDEVRVTARQTFHTDSEKEADEMIAEAKFTLVQQGNDVVAEFRVEKKSSGWSRGNWPRVSVDYIVAVPRAYSLDLRTSGGDIDVGNVKGSVKARTSGGDMEFARVEGDIDAHTSGGNVLLREGTASAKLGTSGGNIHVERAGGPTQVSTSGGDIRLESVARLISATTSGGDIYAKVTEPITEDTTLGTSGGTVKVWVQKGSAFTLDANTSGGDVDAEGLTLTIERGGVGKSRLVGAVNGGGPRLKLRSSGGSILIRAQ